MQAIADQLTEQFSGVTDVDLHIEHKAFLAAELPAIDIFPTSASIMTEGLASFADQYGGIPLAIRVRVSPGDIDAGESLLLDLMDDEASDLSIVAALDADRTLGGVAQTLSWGAGWPWSGYTNFPDVNGDGMFLGSLMSLVVVKAHS